MVESHLQLDLGVQYSQPQEIQHGRFLQMCITLKSQELAVVAAEVEVGFQTEPEVLHFMDRAEEEAVELKYGMEA